jgi:hypothetical protein
MHQQGRCVRLSLILILLLQALTGSSQAQQGSVLESVLIESHKPYDRLIRAIQGMGGRVTQQYTFVDGVAAEIPAGAMTELRNLPGVTAIYKDTEVPKPQSRQSARGRSNRQETLGAVATGGSSPLNRISASEVEELASSHSGVYAINNAGTNIEQLHARGLMGQGATVAVIDSGIRIGFKLLQDSVIGGVDFVDDGAPGVAGDGQADWKQSSNDGHGTFTAGLIAGSAAFRVNRVFEDALQSYAPGSLVEGRFPLIGTAPGAKIYVVRIFGDNASTGARATVVAAALEHVIGLRKAFNDSNGREGLKIDVANMSFGVSTLAAGRSILDKLVDTMLEVGIVPVVSVGDTGPSTMTNSSPGSSMSAVTVGGTSRAANERILNEVLYGTGSPQDYYPGIGRDVRPFDGTEVAWFSSRGSNADGRLDPDVVASGVGNIGQGYCPDQTLDACFKRISIGNGTSFSAPVVSGIAAVLGQACPHATATQIRNVIISTARSTGHIADHFDIHDRGQGLPDAKAAYDLLCDPSNPVPDSLADPLPLYALVRDNVEKNADLDVELSPCGTRLMAGLRPGQRSEILCEIPPSTDKVFVKLSNVKMNGPQNVFFEGGDGLFLYVHSAKTSAIGAVGDYRVNGELFLDQGEGEFELTNLDTGIMRITLNPDTLNAGTVDAEVSVHHSLAGTLTGPLIEGDLQNGDVRLFPNAVHVNANATHLDFLLTWEKDWSRYPTNDVDLIVCGPEIPDTERDCRALGNKKGATLAAPERVRIANPTPGDWTVVIHGFNLPLGGSDHFRLWVTQATD